MRLVLSFLYLAVIIFSTSDFVEASKLKVEVRKESVVSSDKVTLGDIAVINGGDTSEEVEKAGAIFLTHLPVKIKSKKISKGMIASVLKRNGIKVARADFVSPDIIIVSRQRMTVKAHDIQEKARIYLEEVLQEIQGDVVIMSLNHRGGDMSVPEGELMFEFQPVNRSYLSGRISFYVKLLVDGKLVDRVEMKARVEVSREIAVATRTIRRGKILGREDFAMEKKVIRSKNPNWIMDPEEIIGMRAKRSISGNKVIQVNMLDRPPLVRKEDRVKIVLESKFLKISTAGIAKESGPKGSYIRVMNLDSKKVIVAKVVSEKMVKVDF